MSYTIRLPWPSPRLSPNARGHWAIKAKAARAARHAAFYAVRPRVGLCDWHAVDVRLTFCPPDRRRRDTDNMLAACKPLLDGVADAIGVDDSRWSLSLARGEPVKGGAVVVEIREALA